MKIITKDNKVIEGEPISEGLAKLLSDLDSGEAGISIYGHQKATFYSYIIENFEILLKSTLTPETIKEHILPYISEEESEDGFPN
jgi:hypothetical protein